MIPSHLLNDLLKRVPSPCRAAPNSPYLTLTGLDGHPITREDVDTMRMISEDGLMRVPFPQFRFFFKVGKQAIFGSVYRKSESLCLVAFHKTDTALSPVVWLLTFGGDTDPFSGTVDLNSCRIFDSKSFRDITENCLSRVDEPPEMTEEEIRQLGRSAARNLSSELRSRIEAGNVRIQFLKAKVDILEGLIEPNIQSFKHWELPEQDVAAEKVAMSLYLFLMAGCYEYLAPYNFIAVARPKKEGKSVQWLESREHYTIIHRHHPANNPTITEGSEVAPRLITRTAHSRRAHTRLLSSERYRGMKGQRIFVRASWVGPREWIEKGGKQTYRIFGQAASVPEWLSSATASSNPNP